MTDPVLNACPVSVVLHPERKEKLRKLKAKRNNVKVKELLDKIEEAARSDKNLIPPILEAVKAYTTLGEISDTLRKVFGEYKSSVIL